MSVRNNFSLCVTSLSRPRGHKAATRRLTMRLYMLNITTDFTANQLTYQRSTISDQNNTSIPLILHMPTTHHTAIKIAGSADILSSGPRRVNALRRVPGYDYIPCEQASSTAIRQTIVNTIIGHCFPIVQRCVTLDRALAPTLPQSRCRLSERPQRMPPALLSERSGAPGKPQSAQYCPGNVPHHAASVFLPD